MCLFMQFIGMSSEGCNRGGGWFLLLLLHIGCCPSVAAHFATAIFMSLYYVRIPSGETGRKIVIGGVLCNRLELEGGNERQTAKPMTRDESYSFL